METRYEVTGKSELSLWLDSYNDIFSDFDSRGFNERTLSDDFLNEVRKMAKEKPAAKIELKLLIPTSVRNTESEAVIVKNMHSYFMHFFSAIELEKKSEYRQGIRMTLSGFIIMSISIYVAGLSDHSFFYNAARVILEPAGWFMVWTGLDHLYTNTRRKNHEYIFYSRMAHAVINFVAV